MRGIRRQLRQLIQVILTESLNDEELPPPDEDRVAPDEALGQYVMPNERLNSDYWEVPEKYTSLEASLEDALAQHYYDSDSSELKRIWSELVDLERQGLYSDFLKTPPGTAYRLLTVDIERGSQILGIEPQDMASQTNVALVSPNPPMYVPRSFITSWTLDPRRMVKKTGSSFVPVRPHVATVILVADTSQGQFLFNPKTYRRWSTGQTYEHETEVIGGGTIPLKTAAWLWHGDGRKPLTSIRILDALLTAIGE